MRRVPCGCTTTRPESLRILRCCDTAGRLIGRPSASSATEAGRLASSRRIRRREGSPRAAHGSAAGAGTAPELAIGTGRVGIPLHEGGVAVTGIELSEPMVARLREKVGPEELPVTVGDMATTRVDGEFGLVYLVFN